MVKEKKRVLVVEEGKEERRLHIVCELDENFKNKLFRNHVLFKLEGNL